MVTIQEIRQKYPQYDDMDDATLAKSLHQKHYSDLDYNEFSSKIGLQPQTQPAERGYMDMAGDALAQTGRMVTGGVTGLAGLLANPLNATTNYVGEALGYNPNLSTDVRGQAIEQYDIATNNRGKPTDTLGRIVQAGGEALIGGGALGGIAKLAGASPATVQALGVNNIPSALAEVGAGAGAQTGMEVNPENPMSSLIGGFAGALTPTALANAPRGIAKGFGINPDKIATLEKAGLPVTIPAVSDSDSLKYLASASQNLPMGGKLKSKIDSAYKRADTALRALGFTGNTTPSQAGEKAREGLINWRNQKKSAFKEMDKAFDEIVPKATPLKPELINNIQTKINQIVKNNNLTVEQQRELMNHPALSELQSLVNSAKPKDNPAVMSKILDAQGNPTVVTPASQTSQPISIEALDKARSNIGLLTEKSPLTPNYDSAITGKAYDIIKDIKKQAVMQTGGEKAVKLLEDKNRFYSKYIDEEKNFNAKLVKKLGEAPEAIFNKMTSNNKVGASEAKRTIARLSGEERDAFRDALIYQKGGGEDFSIGKWAGEYAKMSNDAKNAFFMGKGNLRQAHDNLMQGVTIYKDLGKFKNTSNTAVHSFANKILTSGIGTGVGIGAGAVAGFGNVIGAVVTGGATNKIFSELMSSPSATKMLANILKSPPKTETIFRSSLIKALKATGYTDDTAKQEVDALLKDALTQPAFDTPNNPDGVSPQQEPLTLDITPQSFNTEMQAPRGLRNNNPANLKGNDLWLGKTGVDDGGFIQFKTPQAGLRAMAINLANQEKKHGINTVSGLISKYAPNSENDTVSYIEKVANDLGVKPNQKIKLTDKKTMIKLMRSMIEHENGNQPYSNQELLQAINAGISK